MLFENLHLYAGSILKIGTISAAVPPGVTAVDGFYTAKLVGEVTSGQLAVIEAEHGMDWMTCPYSIMFYSTPSPDRIWVINPVAIVEVVRDARNEDTNPGYRRWPDKCPLCGSPGKALYNMLECTKPSCRNYK